MSTREAYYPVTNSVVEWLNHTLFPIEEGTFAYWRRLLPLVKICDDSIQGKAPKYAALSAVKQYNEQYGTSLTYEEIVGRCDYAMADLGDLALYCRLEDQETLIFGDYDEIFEAARNADPTVQWAVVWFPEDGSVAVLRSPIIDRRESLGFHDDHEVCDGMCRGPLPAYVLPPEIEGSIRQDLTEL